MTRGILGFLATLVVVGLLVAVGAGIYQAGVAQGIVDAGRFPAGATVPVAGYGYGYGGWHGPGLFGLLIGLFFLFILFRLIGGAFFGRGRGWGHHGYGYGPGWDRGHGDGPDAPRSWREAREQRMADWHRQLHQDEGSTPGGSAGGASGSAT